MDFSSIPYKGQRIFGSSVFMILLKINPVKRLPNIIQICNSAEVRVQQCGRTLRIIHFLTFPLSTQPLTMRTCSGLSSACVHLAGLPGVQDWLKLWYLGASQLSLPMTLYCHLPMQSHGKKLEYLWMRRTFPTWTPYWHQSRQK